MYFWHTFHWYPSPTCLALFSPPLSSLFLFYNPFYGYKTSLVVHDPNSSSLRSDLINQCRQISREAIRFFQSLSYLELKTLVSAITYTEITQVQELRAPFWCSHVLLACKKSRENWVLYNDKIWKAESNRTKSEYSQVNRRCHFDLCVADYKSKNKMQYSRI